MPSSSEIGSAWMAVLSRSTALALGIFALANMTIGLHRPGFDANLWWIDLRPLPAWGANFFLILSAVSLIAHGVTCHQPRYQRRLVAGVLVVLGLAATFNAIAFYRLVGEGHIRSGFPLPFSLLVAFTCVTLALTLHRTRVPLARRHYVAAPPLERFIRPSFDGAGL